VIQPCFHARTREKAQSPTRLARGVIRRPGAAPLKPRPYLSRGGGVIGDTIFSCPSDEFDLSGRLAGWFLQEPGGLGFHRQAWTHFSSYAFNSEARGTNNDYGMARRIFSSVNDPSRTVLVGEISGFAGLSAHDRTGRAAAALQFADARNVMSFVDGHASFIKIYWNGQPALEGFPIFYEPIPGYDYKWSGN
jgi:hypothetical protein